MIVDFDWYANVYMGEAADTVSFPPLCARAEDVIGAMTHWRVTCETFQSLHPTQKALYKKAVCAQIDFFAVNGLDSVNDTIENGFTVGKVRIGGQNGLFSTTRQKGAMQPNISPLSIMYQEQSGLMHPTVPVVQGGME